MFEAVAAFGRAILRKCQSRVDQTRNPGRNLISGSRTYHFQQLVRKLLSNDSRDLGDLFGRPEPVEPRHQRIVQSGGHSCPIRRRRFTDCFGQLFDEERHTISLCHDVFDHSRRKRVGRSDPDD